MSTSLSTRPPEDDRRPGELTFRELLRWIWRQVTSMRTALILLLLLALAAIPGSVIPQEGVDSLKTSNWQADHPKLTPVYERLGLFSVYDSAVVLRDLHPADDLAGRLHRAAHVPLLARDPRQAAGGAEQPDPPARPRVVHDRPTRPRSCWSAADGALRAPALPVDGDHRRRRSRPSAATCARSATWSSTCRCWWCWSGFAVGGLFGYKGGVILLVGDDYGFSNNLTQYDEFNPGSLFQADDMEPFSFTIDDFDVDWLTTGPRAGMARGFQSHLTYQESPDAPEKTTTSGSTTRCRSATPTSS